MGLWQTILGFLRETRLMAALLFCGILAVLSVIIFFLILRPRRGTTEWMKRIEPSKATWFPAPELCAADALRAVLSMLLAAVLQSVFLFFWLRLHLRSNPFTILAAAFNFILIRMGLAAVLAAGIYLLMRCMFRSYLSAICPAALSGLLIVHYTDTLILLVFSLLSLYLWLCGEDRKPLFPQGLWLAVSGMLLGWAFLTCPQTVWLLPFYLAVYVCKQGLRFYRGDPLRRVKRLILSLVLVFMLLTVGLVLLFLFYALISKRYEGEFLENIRSLAFYRNILPLVREKLSVLFTREITFRQSILVKDSLLFIFGSLSVIPLFYGLFVQKELRCAWLLCLAACLALPWLLCSVYLMNLPLLLLLCYSWDTYCRRGRGFILPVYSALLAGAYIVLLI